MVCQTNRNMRWQPTCHHCTKLVLAPQELGGNWLHVCPASAGHFYSNIYHLLSLVPFVLKRKRISKQAAIKGSIRSTGRSSVFVIQPVQNGNCQDRVASSS